MGWSSFQICVVVAVASLAATPAAIAERTCYCRTATGEKLEVGRVTCLKTNKGMREARCDLVLNNTAWIFTGNHCPVADRGADMHDTVALTPDGQTTPPRAPQLPAPAIFYNVRLAGGR